MTYSQLVTMATIAKSARGTHAELYSGVYGKTAMNAAEILTLSFPIRKTSPAYARSAQANYNTVRIERRATSTASVSGSYAIFCYDIRIRHQLAVRS